MLTDTRAANMAEYAIIAVLILADAYLAFTGFGKQITNAICKAGGAFGGSTEGC
jgi:hypothetical protein